MGDAVVGGEQAGKNGRQAAGGAGTGEKGTQADKRARGERRRAGTASGECAIRIELAWDPIGKYGNNGPRIRVRGIRSLVGVRCAHRAGYVDIIAANEPVRGHEEVP